MANHQNKLSKLWDELKRRKVVRVIIVIVSFAGLFRVVFWGIKNSANDDRSSEN